MEKTEKILFDSKIFGERLKNKRVELGLSQVELARSMGFKTSSSLTNIEKGKTLVDIEFLYHISKIFNCDLHWLITGNPAPPNNDIETKCQQFASLLTRYFTGTLSYLLGERDSLSEELRELKETQSSGGEVDPYLIDFITERLPGIQSQINNLWKDKKWLDIAMEITETLKT